MKKQVQLSPETKKEPTHTKTLQADYTRALVRLFRRFKEQAIEALQHAKISGGHGVPDMVWFDNRIRDIALSTIIVPGRHITAEYTLKNYRAGLKFAELALKRAGFVPIASQTKSDIIQVRNDQHIISALVVNNLSDLRGISDETVKQIIQEMTAAIRKMGSGQHLGQPLGISLRSLQDNELEAIIDDRVEKIGVVRSGAMGSTDTIAAFSTAEQQEYTRNGIEQVIWITAEDERTCNICSPLDGELMDMDETFDPPPLHVACRCSFIPATGLEPTIPEPGQGIPGTERATSIPILKEEDVPETDMKRYREKYGNDKTKVLDPIPQDEFAEYVSKAVNTPEMRKVLGDVKIVLLPWGTKSTLAWTDPNEPNTIFLPQYDYRDMDINETYGLKAFATYFEEQHPELADNQEYQDWKARISEATIEDGLQKTALHEKGHLETMDALERDGGDRRFRAYFNGVINGTHLIVMNEEYLKVPEVQENLSDPRLQDHPEAIPYHIGELIAEDYRTIKQPEGKVTFPNKYLFETDLLHPERMKARQDTLRKIYKW